MNAVAISVVVVIPDKHHKLMTVCVCNACEFECVLSCSCVCSCFGKQQINELQMPDGVLKWIANWATTLSTLTDTAQKVLEQVDNWSTDVPVFFPFLFYKGSVCRNKVSASLMNFGWCETVSSRGAQWEMQRPCWETLQSYLPSCLPLRLRPSLSTSLSPLSECAPIFPHHHFSTLFSPYPAHPSLTQMQRASALSFSFILGKRGVRLMSLFLGVKRVHQLCVPPINVVVNARIC